MDEPNFPENLASLIQRIGPLLQAYFAPDLLRVGGGSVLQARWSHRVSNDIEMFVEPQVYNSVILDRRDQLEKSLEQIDGVDGSRCWVDLNALYLECEGVEVSLLPVASLKQLQYDFVVPQTEISTDYTSSILAQKLVYRMGAANIFEIRDLWDLHYAQENARGEFLDAMRFVTTPTALSISTLLATLPANLLAKTDKPLMGVRERVDSRALIESVRNAILEATSD